MKILSIATYRHIPSQKVFRSELEQDTGDDYTGAGVSDAVTNIANQISQDVDASKHIGEVAVLSMLGYKACADWSKYLGPVFKGSLTFCSTNWQFNYTVKAL